MTIEISSVTTPTQAVEAMVSAGAIFTVRQRDDGLGSSLTYRVEGDGDLQLCRRILAAAKSKPAQFYSAFQIAVQRVAREGVE